MKKILAPALLLLSANVCAQFPIEAGNITSLQIHNNPDSKVNSGQRYIVKLNSTISINECGHDQWTGYLDSEVDKAQYSALLATFMASKPVTLEGTAPDRCDSGSVLIRNVYITE